MELGDNMNDDIKAEWVKRLRDGRPQIKGALDTKEGQCCLGVLSEIAAEAGIVEKVTLDGDELAYDGNSKSLTVGVQKWAGLKGDDGANALGTIKPRMVQKETGKTYVTCLAEANDAGLTFNEIADIVEAEL
jgi:hypothetical protein